MCATKTTTPRTLCVYQWRSSKQYTGVALISVCLSNQDPRAIPRERAPTVASATHAGTIVFTKDLVYFFVSHWAFNVPSQHLPFGVSLNWIKGSCVPSREGCAQQQISSRHQPAKHNSTRRRLALDNNRLLPETVCDVSSTTSSKWGLTRVGPPVTSLRPSVSSRQSFACQSAKIVTLEPMS